MLQTVAPIRSYRVNTAPGFEIRLNESPTEISTVSGATASRKAGVLEESEPWCGALSIGACMGCVNNARSADASMSPVNNIAVPAQSNRMTRL